MTDKNWDDTYDHRIKNGTSTLPPYGEEDEEDDPYTDTRNRDDDDE